MSTPVEVRPCVFFLMQCVAGIAQMRTNDKRCLVDTILYCRQVSSEAAALLVECETSFQPFSFNALASLPLVPNPPKV